MIQFPTVLDIACIVYVNTIDAELYYDVKGWFCIRLPRLMLFCCKQLHKQHKECLVFMPPKELWEAYSNRTVRPSVSPSVPLRVRYISPIFFEVGTPNLVCGCILG